MNPTKVQSAAAEVCPLIASQTRRGCLCDPPHPRVGGMHPCHLDPSQRLAEEAQAQQACPSRSTIPECYRDFTDVFSEEAFAHLPPHKAWDHAIELHPDAKLPRGRTFPLSPTEHKELDEFLRENLV